MNNKEKIIKFCKDLGLDTIGVTSCRKLEELDEYLINRKNMGVENEFEEKDIEKRINPGQYLEGGKSIISIAFPYLFKDNSKDGEVYFSKYTFGRDYHKVISKYLKEICEYITNLGGRSIYFVDSNALPERYIASLCGIGFIGKNNMIITEKYGSFVFLGEIITDLELEEDERISSKCGECNLCLEACPTKSIKEEGDNPNICLSYITQKKHIDDKWFPVLNGRIFGCDTCQTVCPYNKYIKKSNINDFLPFEFMENPQIEELINLDNKSFKEKYGLTSCSWRGKNLLIRNAMINAFIKGKLNKNMIKDFTSPYLKDYYNRLFNR